MDLHAAKEYSLRSMTAFYGMAQQLSMEETSCGVSPGISIYVAKLGRGNSSNQKYSVKIQCCGQVAPIVVFSKLWSSAVWGFLSFSLDHRATNLCIYCNLNTGRIEICYIWFSSHSYLFCLDGNLFGRGMVPHYAILLCLTWMLLLHKR